LCRCPYIRQSRPLDKHSHTLTQSNIHALFITGIQMDWPVYSRTLLFSLLNLIVEYYPAFTLPYAHQMLADPRGDLVDVAFQVLLVRIHKCLSTCLSTCLCVSIYIYLCVSVCI
jgi:hypothetical protein